MWMILVKNQTANVEYDQRCVPLQGQMESQIMYLILDETLTLQKAFAKTPQTADCAPVWRFFFRNLLFGPKQINFLGLKHGNLSFQFPWGYCLEV